MQPRSAGPGGALAPEPGLRLLETCTIRLGSQGGSGNRAPERGITGGAGGELPGSASPTRPTFTAAPPFVCFGESVKLFRYFSRFPRADVQGAHQARKGLCGMGEPRGTAGEGCDGSPAGGSVHPGSGLPPGQGEGNSLARNSRGLDSPGSRQKKQEVHLGFRNCTPAKDTTGEGSGQGCGIWSQMSRLELALSRA